MALTLRNTKGSALTYSELDNNFTFITGSVDTVSASLSSRVAAQESFSSSLDTFYATDAQVYAQTASLSASISTVRTTLSSSLSSRIAAQEAFSASLDATYATDAQLNTATASLSASLATSIATVSSSLVSASFVELSSSYNNASASLSASISLLSGSYIIASSSLSASISDLSSSYNTLSSSFIAVSASVLDHATTGSNTFIGSQIITGSILLSSGSRLVLGPTGSSITGSRSFETGSIFWNTDSGSWWGFNGNRFIYFVTGNFA